MCIRCVYSIPIRLSKVTLLNYDCDKKQSQTGSENFHYPFGSSFFQRDPCGFQFIGINSPNTEAFSLYDFMPFSDRAYLKKTLNFMYHFFWDTRQINMIFQFYFMGVFKVGHQGFQGVLKVFPWCFTCTVVAKKIVQYLNKSCGAHI